jgi:hypothetical protein
MLRGSVGDRLRHNAGNESYVVAPQWFLGPSIHLPRSYMQGPPFIAFSSTPDWSVCACDRVTGRKEDACG